MSLKSILSWTLLLFIGLFSCNEGDGPTSFQGVVVYADDNTPFVDGYIQFSGERPGIGTAFADFGEICLEDNGSFEIIFNASEDIIGFNISVRDTVDLDIIRPEEGLECGAIPCEAIPPGKNYRDLIITIPR